MENDYKVLVELMRIIARAEIVASKPWSDEMLRNSFDALIACKINELQMLAEKDDA